MPEGPTIVILKEEATIFKNKVIVNVSGNTTIEKERMIGQQILDLKSWGKHFLICFETFTLKVHFLLFGSYRINEGKETVPRLRLEFDDGEFNFYACSVKFLEGDINSHYDWSSDVMNDQWDAGKAKTKLEALPDKLICDLLLEQDIFSGVGNIIKNEVLYRVGVHPESVSGKIPEAIMAGLLFEARNYSFQFLEWKKQFELKKHWLAHSKKTCHRCELPLIKKQTGVKKRRSFYCGNCQNLYD